MDVTCTSSVVGATVSAEREHAQRETHRPHRHTHRTHRDTHTTHTTHTAFHHTLQHERAKNTNLTTSLFSHSFLCFVVVNTRMQYRTHAQDTPVKMQLTQHARDAGCIGTPHTHTPHMSPTEPHRVTEKHITGLGMPSPPVC